MAATGSNGGRTSADRAPEDAPSATQRTRALAHPLRARIVAALGEKEVSPVELAAALGADLGVLSYHVRVLAQAGVIELARTTARRGAIQHHYRRARGRGRYFDSVELRPKAARELTAEISDAIARAQRRSEAENSGRGDRVAVTVVVQPTT
jgi:DNA-binding transcriptional ArsR family regulator